jgi:hypothetical protein
VVALLFAGACSAICSNPNSPDPCYGVPDGALVLAPQNMFAPTNQDLYAALQTGYWEGTISCTWEISETGTVVGTASEYKGTRNDRLTWANSAILVPSNGYIGPASLTVTCTATSRYGPPEALSAGVVLGIQ